jgi:superfamily I DNA and/or RNA helicase
MAVTPLCYTYYGHTYLRSQALETTCWVALLRGRRAVLAGDHQQLPPVVKSEAAAALEP